MEKENIDLKHQPIQTTKEILEEKSCLLKEQPDHIDVDILDEQVDADIPDEHSDADIQGEEPHFFDTEVLEDRKEVEMVDEHCDETVHNFFYVMVLNATKK